MLRLACFPTDCPFRTRPMRPAGRATGRPDPVPLDMEAL